MADAEDMWQVTITFAGKPSAPMVMRELVPLSEVEGTAVFVAEALVNNRLVVNVETNAPFEGTIFVDLADTENIKVLSYRAERFVR